MRLHVACTAGALLLAGVLTIVSRTSYAQDVQELGSMHILRMDTNRWVAILREGKYVLGHLDKYGNYIEFRDADLINPNAAFSGPEYTVINKPQKKNEVVYEFRSGILVMGILDVEGNFVPIKGSSIIEMKDYKVGPSEPRIYNLPGTIEKKAN